MTKKQRSVLLSVLTMMLCIALLASASYALFSDQVDLTNHLQAGTLDITLTRTNLVTKTLDNQTGYLKEKENPEDVDFSEPTKRNLFDLTEVTKIVPGCEWNAEMQIANKSDVAFRYWIEIKLKGDGNDLAKQMKVVISTQGSSEPQEAWLIDGMTVGTEATPISVLEKGSSQLFTVQVMFVDDENQDVDFTNNDAKGEALSFDIVIHALQETTAPTP